MDDDMTANLSTASLRPSPALCDKTSACDADMHWSDCPKFSSGPSPAPTAELAAGDLFLSLTGFDEIAVARAFGEPVTDLRNRPTMFMRAMVFIDQRRRGLKDREAHQAAMAMTFQAITDYFPEDDDDEDSPAGEADGR